MVGGGNAYGRYGGWEIMLKIEDVVYKSDWPVVC